MRAELGPVEMDDYRLEHLPAMNFSIDHLCTLTVRTHLSVCLPTCLSADPPVCLTNYLSVCLTAQLPVHILLVCSLSMCSTRHGFRVRVNPKGVNPNPNQR